MSVVAVQDFTRLRSGVVPGGAHCDHFGAFVENVPLLRIIRNPNGGFDWAPRDPQALNLDLGSGYCFAVDSTRIANDLGVVAGALNEDDLYGARDALARLKLPAFAERRSGRLDGASQGRLASLLREISLLKEGNDEPKDSDFEAEHPREPKGSAGGIGGQFAQKPQPANAEPSTNSPKVQLSPVVRTALKGLIRLAKKYGWELVFPEGLGLNVLYNLLEARDLNVGEDELMRAHFAAEQDFAGGKTLAEINAHPGGEGYQMHHFLENTAENQNLPDGLRETPENKGYIPTFSHEDIHAELSSKDKELGNKSLRDSLRGRSVEEQLAEMFKLMRKYGILK